MPTSLFLCLALLSVCWTAIVRAQQDDPCDVCDEVHFFLARGNNEPYPGRQGMLVEATCNGLASCGYEDLHYSALYTDLSCQTTYDGSVAGHVQMTAYAEKCPDSKIILAGYSQGGQIAGDILGGGSGLSFNGCEQPETPAMDPNSSPGNKIAAIIVFGDTRHNANQPWNFGSGSSMDGLYPRNATQLANLEPYSDRMRNWCVDTDPICAGGSIDMENAKVSDHLNYFNVDSQSAASWIKSVASLTNTDSSFTTTVPISISGTAQDYATVPTATPSGSVKLDTTWTDSSSFAACTATSYSHTMAAANVTASSSMSATTDSASMSASSATESAISSLLTQASTQAAGVTGSTVASPSSSSDSSSSGAIVCSANVGGLLGMLAAGAFFGMVLL